MTESTSPQFFTTVGYLHDPERNMDRIAVGTTGSLDEYPTLQLSGPDLGTYTFESTDALDMRRSVLETVADEARALADGEAVDAYVMLAAAVDAFLAGKSAEEIFTASHPRPPQPYECTVVLRMPADDGRRARPEDVTDVLGTLDGVEVIAWHDENPTGDQS